MKMCGGGGGSVTWATATARPFMAWDKKAYKRYEIETQSQGDRETQRQGEKKTQRQKQRQRDKQTRSETAIDRETETEK